MLAHAAYDLDLGSGLTVNRIQAQRLGILSCLRLVSCPLNQWFAIDRCRPSGAVALQARRSELTSIPDSPPTGKPRKLPKNDCVFTPLVYEVNKNRAILSPLFSIECSSSTGL